MTAHFPSCVLIDLEAARLSDEERELLSHPVCAGIVLFSRNYQNPRQLRELTASIREINPQALIAVDQEGGRVQRFREGFTTLPPMSHWGEVYDQDPQTCYRQLTSAIQVLTSELKEVGVNLDLIPVLDLNYGISEVIGTRSFHEDPEKVIELGRLVINELHRHHFPAVGKHFPGHGGVAPDTHQDLPVDPRDWLTLWRQDLRPFTALIHQLDAIMPAHIVFSAMDHRPASFSPFWLHEVLRRQLGFQGVIISDDLSMASAATRGSYAQRAAEAFLAGCDLLLVCNNRAGAIAALDALLPYERRDSAQRLAAFYSKCAMI
jgi:beta-N-acetylhexosaminidase